MAPNFSVSNNSQNQLPSSHISASLKLYSIKNSAENRFENQIPIEQRKRFNISEASKLKKFKYILKVFCCSKIRSKNYLSQM